VTVDTCGSDTNFDTYLAVFTGPCGTLSCVEINDDSCGTRSSITWSTELGVEYRILVFGFLSASGSFGLRISFLPDVVPSTDSPSSLAPIVVPPPSPGMTPTTVPSPSSCDFIDFDGTFAPNLDIRYITRILDPVTGNGTLTLEATYAGVGWVGIGWNLVDRMVPGESVIGNSSTEVGKWEMAGYFLGRGGVQKLPQEQQTLTDTSFVQNATHSVLTFTKILMEPGEIPINGSGSFSLLWAYGMDNQVRYHLNRGITTVIFTPCDDDEPVPTITTTSAPVPGPTLAPFPPSPGFASCNVCGNGLRVTNAAANVDIPIIEGLATCATFERFGALGYIEPSYCPLMPGYATPCNCQP